MRSMNAAAMIVVLSILASAIRAGQLDPPAGQIEPTGRFGTQIEVSAATTPGSGGAVFQISQAGSYFLTENLEGESGKSGIEITVSDVTLDLSGYTVQGGPGTADGIRTSAGVHSITIRNGSVRDWGGFGIGPDDNVNAASRSTLEDLVLEGNGNHGVFFGPHSLVRKCHSSNNTGGADGISVGPNSVVTHCVAMGNATNGFSVGANSIVTSCTATDNGPSGFADGFDLGAGCVLRECVAASNAANGVRAISGKCHLSGCTVRVNGGFGILAPDSLIVNCLVDANSGGECDAAGSTLVSNHGCP